MEAIRVRDLTFSYDGRTNAVDHVTFAVSQGEGFGFLGPSGAGKSTTIKLLTGLLVPPPGTVYLLGQDMTRIKRPFYRQIGISFEIEVLYPTLTGFENLYVHASLYGITAAEIEQVLKTMDLYHAKDKPASAYSRGMKTRLVLARAIVTRPRILFLDEPTSGMDPDIAAHVRDVLLDLKRDGTTLFVTTHDMHEAEKLCDRVAFFNNGWIGEVDSPASFKQRYGSPQVTVEVNGESRTLDRQRDWDALARLFADNRWTRIHSQESTLEDIFIRVVGRGLKEGG